VSSLQSGRRRRREMQSWCSPSFFRTFSVSWILDLWASSYIFTCILVCLYRISWSRLSQNCTQKTLPSYDECDHHIFPPANKPYVGPLTQLEDFMRFLLQDRKSWPLRNLMIKGVMHVCQINGFPGWWRWESPSRLK
jgi:hypothetical protein